MKFHMQKTKQVKFGYIFVLFFLLVILISFPTGSVWAQTPEDVEPQIVTLIWTIPNTCLDGSSYYMTLEIWNVGSEGGDAYAPAIWGGYGCGLTDEKREVGTFSGGPNGVLTIENNPNVGDTMVFQLIDGKTMDCGLDGFTIYIVQNPEAFDAWRTEPETVPKQTDAYWQLIETSVPDGIDSAQHDYGTYEMLLSDLGLMMLDTQSGAGVQFAWSRPPDRIPCGEEGLLEIDLGVAPYNEKSWVMQTAVGLGMDIVNEADEVLYAEYSQPLYCDVGQNGEPMEYYETFSPEANGLEAFYRQGNRLRISFLHEGDADHYVRYIYDYVPSQSYEAVVEGGTEVLPPENGGADKENSPGPLAIAVIAVVGVGVVGVGIAGIAGIAAVVAKSTAAAAVPSLPTTEYSSAQSENERIDREMRIRHAEMDRRLGLDDLEKQRTGTSAQDKIVREEMRKISKEEEKREYKERVMKKYGTDNEMVASNAAQKERDSWEKSADAWRLSGNIAAAGEVGATIVGAAANASADVITRIPGCGWYRPVYRMATSIAGETAKEIAFKNKKTYGEAIKTGLVKGTVKGVFEAARGFVSSPFDKGMTAVCGNTFGEMAGAAIEGGDVKAAGEKGMINGVYEGLTRAFTDKLATKSPIVNAPPSLWDGLKSLLNNNEVRVKTVGGPVRKLAKPYII